MVSDHVTAIPLQQRTVVKAVSPEQSHLVKTVAVHRDIRLTADSILGRGWALVCRKASVLSWRSPSSVGRAGELIPSPQRVRSTAEEA